MNPTQSKRIAAALFCTVSTVPGLALGALIDRGGGLIYDTDLDVTWLANANYSQTSGYDADGRMTWAAANAWAANLSYYDNVRGVFYDDWRLPSTLQPDASCGFQSSVSYGYNCKGSEMGHLFYDELGGFPGINLAMNHDADYNLFSDIQGYVYWSATSADVFSAMDFQFDIGFQGYGDTANEFYAWAVRPGDVTSVDSTVPLPAAAWLFAGGLLSFAGVSAKRRR